MLKALFIFPLILVSLSRALACDKKASHFICPGDTVAKEGFVGTVLGVNSSKQTADVRWNTDSTGVSISTGDTYKISSLSLGLGCVDGYCVGDTVAKEGFVGTILGVNPYHETADVRWNTDSTGVSISSGDTYEISSLSLGLGCVDGYCVGDTVAKEGFVGTVLGLNSSKQTADVRWNTNSTGVSISSGDTYKISSLSNNQYCTTYGQRYRKGNGNMFMQERLRNHYRQAVGFNAKYWY